ncbi:hypothetical protein HIM_07358 [Hirsutella minnesotensis 3608]|uniref:Peptidase M60 domain-containing protein n=1 Tax=Hirsutella minnesotensis 3608 TaxID=1043627 RepID=A0A0F7ZHV1_9HYPO|nr:hypothetical protein HIM_07358 [Hirsutella minnesotensis 3608]
MRLQLLALALSLATALEADDPDRSCSTSSGPGNETSGAVSGAATGWNGTVTLKPSRATQSFKPQAPPSHSGSVDANIATANTTDDSEHGSVGGKEIILDAPIPPTDVNAIQGDGSLRNRPNDDAENIDDERPERRGFRFGTMYDGGGGADATYNGGDDAEIVLESVQESRSFYTGLSQTIWSTVQNKGPSSADALILESPDLGKLGLSIKGAWNCPETKAGAPRIHCVWNNAAPGFQEMPTFSFVKHGDAREGTLDLKLDLTYYKKDPRNGQMMAKASKSWTHQWAARAGLSGLKQANPSRFPNRRVLTLPALLEADYERHRLRQQFLWADFHSTGFFLNAGREVSIDISGLSRSGPQPEILVGTPALISPEHRNEDMPGNLERCHVLTNGKNLFHCQISGIVYVRYSYSPARQSEPPPPVTLNFQGQDEFQPIPLFREGQTTMREWRAMLEETKVPFVEVDGRRVIITGVVEDLKSYTNLGEDIQELLNGYGRVIDAQNAISALDPSSPDPRHRPSPLRPMIVRASESRYADAFDYRAALGSKNVEEIWKPAQLSRSWRMWHELGHQRQHSTSWSWNAMMEVTVNIYSLAVRRLFANVGENEIEHPTRQDWEDTKAYLALSDQAKNFDTADGFVQLAMFEQLRVAFGDAFYHRLHRISRENPPLRGDADLKDNFMRLSADIARQDLTTYFVRWGLRPEQRTIQHMSRYPKANEDLSTKHIYQDLSL